MEKYDILKSDEEKFIIINFENLFKPTDIQYSIDETVNDELKKSLNPIIDVEYVRYKPEGSYTIIPQFLLNNNYSSSYVNANFPIEEHLTSLAFRNTLFINEYYDSNDINKNILLSKNTLKVDEDKTYIINNKEVSANINFTNNFKTEFSFIYVPKFFVDKNVNKIFLKLNFFNSKNGSKTTFTFDDNQTNESFYHQINLNNTNYTWNMNNSSPKQYINAFIDNKIKDENRFNQEVGEEPRKNNIILSTGEILSIKNNGVNSSSSFDIPDDIIENENNDPNFILSDKYVSGIYDETITTTNKITDGILAGQDFIYNYRLALINISNKSDNSIIETKQVSYNSIKNVKTGLEIFKINSNNKVVVDKKGQDYNIEYYEVNYSDKNGITYNEIVSSYYTTINVIPTTLQYSFIAEQ